MKDAIITLAWAFGKENILLFIIVQLNYILSCIFRYNAEKKKIGMYYSTPVYQFRMKCHLCNNHFEIKTDPGVRLVFYKFTNISLEIFSYNLEFF